MSVQDIINRRSVKEYKPDLITDEELNTLLEAGKNCPTGGNTQSPVMVVVRDPATVKRFSELNLEVIGKSGMNPFYGAPMVIIVLADSTKMCWSQDGSLCMGNLCNAAYSMGLGGRWINRAKEMFETEEGKTYLKKWGLSEDYVGIGCFIVGYPANGFPEPLPHKDDYVIFDS